MNLFATSVALLIPLAINGVHTTKAEHVIPEILASKNSALGNHKPRTNGIGSIAYMNKLAKALPEDGILVEYQRHSFSNSANPKDDGHGDDRYLAIVLKPDGSINNIDLGSAARIDEAISKAVKAVEHQLVDAPELLAKVSDLVIQPLREATAGAKSCFISPDGELKRIPFAALSAPSGVKLLGEALQVRLLIRSHDLLDLAERSKKATQKPLVLANPNFGQAEIVPGLSGSNSFKNNGSVQQSSNHPGVGEWHPLTGTEREGSTISKLINAQLLTGKKATELAVKNHKAPKILHIASHTYAFPNQRVGDISLQKSAIVLAGVNQSNTNSNEDGYLTDKEVAKLNLEGTEMVVVSNQGTSSLLRAIAAAGARSSLLSLWSVEDAATVAFMESFYQRLKAGEGRADALAATQKEFRNHPIPLWREPYVWAAFQLSGDWAPIQGI